MVSNVGKNIPYAGKIVKSAGFLTKDGENDRFFQAIGGDMSQHLGELAVRRLQEDNTTRAYDSEVDATGSFVWMAYRDLVVVGPSSLSSQEFAQRVERAIGEGSYGQLLGVGRCFEGRIERWKLEGVPSVPLDQRDRVAQALNVSRHRGL